MDITAGSGFDWLRWVAGVEGAHDIIRDGVVRVYAVRWFPHAVPDAAFCYGLGTYMLLSPTTMRSNGSSRPTRGVQQGESDWRAEPLLCAAPVASR